MTVGFDTFFPKRPDTKFIVKNVTDETLPQKKVVKVFTYPIPPGKTRDLMAIPAVSEADIRHALLKGELRIKLEAKELIVVESNIDLLQFDSVQKTFLQSIGITNGLTADSALTFSFQQGIILSGAVNGLNRIFTTPDKFINGIYGANRFSILVKHNGRTLVENTDYTISESGGLGAGFDTITIISFTPKTGSTMIADYIVRI